MADTAAHMREELFGLNTSDALTKVEAEVPASPEIEYIVDFIRNSERGIIR